MTSFDAPRALALELAKGCNLRCAYCYYAEREDAYDPSTRMSEEVAERSVELLFEDESDAPVHLHFFGGEPLLNVPLLQHTVAYAERRSAETGRRVTYEVTTNGTRLTDEVIAFLNDHAVKVGVSFDGPPEVQDAARPHAGGSSYGLAAPKIERLLVSRAGGELERATHASVVLTRREPDVMRIVKHLEGMGFRRILLTPATDLESHAEGEASNGFREEDLPELEAAIEALAQDYEDRIRRGEDTVVTWFEVLMGRVLSGERRTSFCQGGREYLGVSAGGDLNLCYRFLEDDEYAMGNVFDGVDRGVTERLDEHAPDTRTSCSVCWARHFCGGGCHHDNVHAGGGLGEPNPITCDLFRFSMDRTLAAWARLTKSGHLGARAPVTAAASMTSPATNMTNPEEGSTAELTLRRTEGAHVRELDNGEVAVYEPRSHELCVLSRVAAFVFDRCDGKRTRDDLLALLEERYEAPRDVLAADLDATLANLREKHLVH